MLLRRAPSFTRQRKAPRLPPPSSTPQHVGSSPATYTPAPEGEVVICKALRGWLKKRHRSDKSLGPKWGARFVWVDENEGTLCYSKAQNYSSSARTCVRLSEVTAVVPGNESGMELPANCFVIRCSGAAGERPGSPEQTVFCAEDREEAIMWIAQLSARAKRTTTVDIADGDDTPHTQTNATRGRRGLPPSSEAPPELMSDSDVEEASMPAAAPEPATAANARSAATANAVAAAQAAAVAAQAPAATQLMAMHVPITPVGLNFGRIRADFVPEHDCELGCSFNELLLPLPWMPAPPGWSFAARPNECRHGLVPTEYLEIVPSVVHVPRLPAAEQPAYAPAEEVVAAPVAEGGGSGEGEGGGSDQRLSPRSATNAAIARAQERARSRPQPISVDVPEVPESAPMAAPIVDNGAGVFEPQLWDPPVTPVDETEMTDPAQPSQPPSRTGNSPLKRKLPPSPPPSAPSYSPSEEPSEAASVFSSPLQMADVIQSVEATRPSSPIIDLTEGGGAFNKGAYDAGGYDAPGYDGYDGYDPADDADDPTDESSFDAASFDEAVDATLDGDAAGGTDAPTETPPRMERVADGAAEECETAEDWEREEVVEPLQSRVAKISVSSYADVDAGPPPTPEDESGPPPTPPVPLVMAAPGIAADTNFAEDDWDDEDSPSR